MATILIVDDVSANREHLVTLLGLQGHRMLEAANGREALATVHSERPDLVITDVLMPVMNGYEFVRQLRLDPTTGNIPVVFYTAQYGEREARTLALAGEVSDVLTKPTVPEEVLKIVGRVLSGELDARTPPGTSPLATESDREHLRLVSNQLSEEVGDLRAANARLRALINVGLELPSEKASGHLLRRVCVAAHDVFGASYVTIGIVDQIDRTVQQVEGCGVSVTDGLTTGDPAPGILGTIVAERRTIRGDNPGGDPAALGLSLLHPEVHAYLAAPITSPAHVYGWICLVGNEGRTFTEDDEQLLRALAGQVGRIYENGHFYRVAQRRTEQLEHEIGERERAESALRLERDRAQRFLDTAEVILLALDTEARVTLINRHACSILGWEVDELLGCNWIETCLPQRVRRQMGKAFEGLLGGDTSTIESPILTRSGAERLIEWRNTLLLDDGGQVTGTFSSGTDITERGEAVQAVRTAEERMRFALESADVGIWDLDYTTGVLRWSETLEAHYGLQPGTFPGTFEAFIERVYPEDRESLIQTIENATKSSPDFTIENRSVWPDGTVRWLNGAGRILLGEDGLPVRGVGISLDVTERHNLEEQYQQAQKMEAIGRLAGGIAHDFNNLLTAILGYCELLLVDLRPLDPSRNDVAEIQKAGMSAAALTRQLLAFSRKQIVEPTLLDLNAVVEDLLAMLERIIGEDVSVVLDLRPAGLVMADRGQMEQVVLNLAVNARDAMPQGGTLKIETSSLEIDEDTARTHLSLEAGPYTMLTVSDTGSGMTPQVQLRLFEPFFTTKEAGKGTGLGLATVHGIVTGSSGSVNFHSEVGKGTSFTVYLPKAGDEELTIEPPRATRPHSAEHTVLVVDDAEGLRELAKRLLQRQGYTVLTAANADEAVQLFGRNPAIDVVLTDVVMPGASGPELTKRLVEQRPGLKVIYMSGYTEEAIVHHGVLNPGIAFLHKPFSSDSLGHKIREVLER